MLSVVWIAMLGLLGSAEGIAASHHPEAFLEQIKGTQEEGQAIVQHFCANCHGEKPIIAVGAPRMGHVADWVLRRQQDPELLWKHASEGYHAMPARGGCFECSDEQLRKAIVVLMSK